MFDADFRPARDGPPPLAARLARRDARRGAAADLRVRVGDAYAVRDGHHRVSVARARGALTIDAAIDAVAAA